MKRTLLRVPAVLLAVAVAWVVFPAERRSVAGPAGEKRVPWTSSKVTGSPDPPHPYRVVRAFPKLQFKKPLHIQSAPGTDRLFVLEHEGKIFSFVPRPDVD